MKIAVTVSQAVIPIVILIVMVIGMGMVTVIAIGKEMAMVDVMVTSCSR